MTDSMPVKSAPVGALATLAAGILLAHIVVLQGTSVALSTSEPTLNRPFITRTIQLAPPTVAVPVNTPSQASPATAATAAPKKRPVAPSNTPESTPNSPSALVEQAQAAIKTIATETSSPPAVTETTPASGPAPVAPELSAQEVAQTPRTFAMPGSTRLKYDVTATRNGLAYQARGELLWLHDGKTYDARLEVGAFFLGARVQTSTGRLTAQGLAPNRFSDKNRGELAAHFDREKGRITFSNGPETPLLTGAQDRLSLLAQLGAMLAGEPGKYPAGTTILVQTVSARAAEAWVVTVEGDEKLQLPGGELATVKLVRNPRREYDQKAEFWLAPSMGYLPVRSRLTEASGAILDLQWRATETP